MTTPVALLKQFRARKLGQWAAAYLAGAWVVLQLLDVAAEPFDWPGVFIRAAWVILAAGFFAVLVLAWYHGERGQQRVSAVELLLLAALLAVAGAGVALVLESEAARAADIAGASAGGSPAGVPVDDVGESSVVVLPFADLSPDQDQEYFADGLTEEILNALVRLPGLRVPARTTSFAFKGRNVPAAEIAQQLGVAHVLEGSVRRDGDRLRITAQLVDARNDRHLWSESYDRGLSDVFAVQEEIAQAVTAALRVRLVPGTAIAASVTAHRLVIAGTADPVTYELYLRGLHAWNRRTAESMRQAVVYLDQAVTQDPSFARGWAALALGHVLLPEYIDTLPGPYTRQARIAAARALELDPGLAETHTALAWAHAQEWRFDRAEREFTRALELNPYFATGYQWYGTLLNVTGRPDQALHSFERALELDPLSFIITANVADHLFYAGDYQTALSRYEQALELNPEGGSGYQARYAVALLYAGQQAKAVATVDSMHVRGDVGDPWSVAQAACVLAKAGRTADARAVAAQLEARRRNRYVSPASRAVIQVCLGNHERAFTLLAEATAARDPMLLYYVPSDPLLDPIRDDARFVRLLRNFQPS